MKSLRFLFVGCSTFHVNATLFRLFMVRHLIDVGHEVHLLLEDSDVNRKWVETHAPGVEAHYQRIKWFPGLVIERRRMIKNLKPDVVHVLGMGIKNVLTISPSSESGCRYAADFDELPSAAVNSYPARLLHGLVEKRALRYSQRIVCASRFLCEHFADKAEDAARLLHLPYGYEPLAFEACELLAQSIRAQFRNRKLLVYVGMLNKAYQADEVLQLAEVMNKRRDDLSFMVIGGGPQLAGYRDLVRRRRLDTTVDLPGYVLPEDVPAYLLAADVLLFPIEDTPANRARCPHKMFQYIGANRPIVTNRVGEVDRILGENGICYDFDDIEDFADKTEYALSLCQTYDAPLLMAEHTWKKRAEKYAAAMARCIDDKQAGSF